MVRTLAHRGPDDAGVWVDDVTGVALAHRRLAILDLSAAGHQPMASACGRFVIAFNGEIYNHAELRSELEERGSAPSWRGHSDTEVLLAAVAAWGIEAALKKVVGMFAFALWDRESRSLALARDRIGEKPLYYGLCRGALLFASELKAIRSYPSFAGAIDRDALSLLLRYGYIPSPYSIYEGICKLPPGTVLAITRRDIEAGALPHPVSYWSAREVTRRGVADPLQIDEADAVEALDRLLRRTIAGQMISEVPLGAFLSGGIDSSTIVALMQAQSSRPVRTFSIGFREPDYNEAEHAKSVAKHLGTDHTEVYVTARQALNVVPRLPEIYDEPFADSSQVPTFLLSQLAKRDVTVSLSGDGGDELFGGYNRYCWTRRIWRLIGWIPQSARAILARQTTKHPPEFWNEMINGMSRFLRTSVRQPNPGDKLHKLANVLPVSSPEAIYECLVSHWLDPASVVTGATEPMTPATDNRRYEGLTRLEDRMMYLDLTSYLPDDILVKVDRAAMAVSLETRMPYLDHRVVEFAWHLPPSMKIRRGQGKWLLRRVLYRYVPKELVERPKMGFGVPLGSWLRGPLREWAEALLDATRLSQEGYFEKAPIRQKWQEHLSGRRNWSYQLWGVLMFQAWLDAQRSVRREEYRESTIGG